MTVQHPSMVKRAQALVTAVVRGGDRVIDATVGNGLDTLFLARLVGASGRVYGFDVQPAALKAAARRLGEAQLLNRVTLIEAGHERMTERVPRLEWGLIKAVMFNLGYLPGGDRALVTCPESTLQALAGSLDLLSRGGCLVVVAYTGHPGGREEADAVSAWVSSLPGARFAVERIRPLTRRRPPPEFTAVRRLR